MDNKTISFTSLAQETTHPTSSSQDVDLTFVSICQALDDGDRATDLDLASPFLDD